MVKPMIEIGTVDKPMTVIEDRTSHFLHHKVPSTCWSNLKDWQVAEGTPKKSITSTTSKRMLFTALTTQGWSNPTQTHSSSPHAFVVRIQTVYIDTGSNTNVIFKELLDKLKVPLSQVKHSSAPTSGVGRDVIYDRRHHFSTHAHRYDSLKDLRLLFHHSRIPRNLPSAFNMIIRRSSQFEFSIQCDTGQSHFLDPMRWRLHLRPKTIGLYKLPGHSEHKHQHIAPRGTRRGNRGC